MSTQRREPELSLPIADAGVREGGEPRRLHEQTDTLGLAIMAL